MVHEPPIRPGDSDRVRELDVRLIAREQRHQLIFAAYEELIVGHALLLINDHEPRHLREEFDRDHAGSYSWGPESEHSPAGDRAYRVRITRLARTPLPRVVADTRPFLAAESRVAEAPGVIGSVWQLQPAGRDLDSNIIALPPGGEIARHDGPNLDVLILVLSGGGTLGTELESIPLRPGELLWLPRTSTRRFRAGDQGLRYLTVHHRKPTLGISAAPVVPKGKM